MSEEKTKFPAEVYLYVCDYDDGAPLFAVAESLTEIPEDNHGDAVASYQLGDLGIFSITRALRKDI